MRLASAPAHLCLPTATVFAAYRTQPPRECLSRHLGELEAMKSELGKPGDQLHSSVGSSLYG